MTAWTVPSYAEWAVPGYTEERLLGHGVSGRVVAAVNDASGQRVAIKYLNKDLVRDPEFLGELRAAAEQLVQLNAPHMVRVLDYVEQPREGAAIVMELVDGVSLRQVLARRGPLGAAAALVVLKDSLLALAAAHARRLPHRDVKPDNVLIAPRGWCMLTDFGVAVMTDKQQRVAGTPEYMAPELWHGAPNVPANDIYAATAVLYESLTGKPPFSGRSGRLREQHESTPVPLDDFGPPVQDLIAWGMAKDPEARPASAMAFLSEVEGRAATAYGANWEDEGRRELAHRGAEAMPLQEGGTGGGSARLSRIARRKIVAYVSAGAVAVVALAAGGVVALSKMSSQQIQLSSVSATSVDPEIAVTHPAVTSKCTAPTTFNFTGSISDLDPGPVSYQWVYSTGQQSPLQTLNFTGAGQELPVKAGAVTTSTAGDGWAQLKVLLNPGAETSDKATYQLQCSTANSDIAVTTTVKPAALAFSSCSAPHPTLTVTGTITAKNAGTVSYYWAMSNGEKTKPDQAIFTAAGTKAADPLTFPAWVPASGNVVLVVTKPVVMTSKPAVYKVTCGPLATAEATADVTPSATGGSAKPSVTPTASTAVPTSAITLPVSVPTISIPTPAPTTSSPTPTPSTSTSAPPPVTPTPTPTLTTTSAPPPPPSPSTPASPAA
jgi:eukaryotic-like serine/threonine-protein kinase